MSATEFAKVCDLPQGAGEFVGMCTFNGALIIAMQGGVFRLDDPTQTLIEVPITGAIDDTQQPG